MTNWIAGIHTDEWQALARGLFNMKKSILVVDDETMITTTLSTLLKMMAKQNVIAFNDPLEALEALKSQKFDMVVSDFMMPEMNGVEFLKRVRELDSEAVLILLTGYADKENAIRSINEVGIYYYLEKPWDNQSLVKIVLNGLEKKNLTEELKRKVQELEQSNKEITRLYDLLKNDYEQEVDNVQNLIISLANVIEAKDNYTDGHTRRVGNICAALGSKLGLGHEELQHLLMAGSVHDIGKVGVPESILNKPGKLTEEEFDIIKKHTVIGETICKPLNSMQKCLDPIRHHHEKLNGTGYPDGLKGDEISLEARILAVADVFDALYSDRPYRERLPLTKVREIMIDEVEKGNLDSRITSLLYDLIDNNEVDKIIST